MSRTLTLQRSIVPPADRRTHLERLRHRRSYYEGAGCRFWVVQELDLAGAFMEFIEAPDAKSLEAALAAAPDMVRDGARLYEEVELD